MDRVAQRGDVLPVPEQDSEPALAGIGHRPDVEDLVTLDDERIRGGVVLHCDAVAADPLDRVVGDLAGAHLGADGDRVADDPSDPVPPDLAAVDPRGADAGAQHDRVRPSEPARRRQLVSRQVGTAQDQAVHVVIEHAAVVGADGYAEAEDLQHVPDHVDAAHRRQRQSVDDDACAQAAEDELRRIEVSPTFTVKPSSAMPFRKQTNRFSSIERS